MHDNDVGFVHMYLLCSLCNTAPPITVLIAGGEVSPSIGYGYTLMCSIFGAEDLNATLVYEWRNEVNKIFSNSSILYFSSLKLSDAGRYACQISVTSNYLHDAITVIEHHNLVIKSRSNSILQLIYTLR